MVTSVRHGTAGKWQLAATLAMTLLLGWHSSATAITYLQYLDMAAGARLATLFFLANPVEESLDIKSSYNAYLLEQKPKTNKVGQAAFQGAFPDALVGAGASGFLTFFFVDPATGAQTAGLPVGSVRYEINTDPLMPNSFSLLGTSFNAASSFALSFTLNTFEPVIQAVPFDPTGSPIFISGEGDQNVALGAVVILVPGPSTLILLGVGAISVLAGAWRASGPWK